MNHIMRMGVVADDVTGANDIGSMFAMADYLTHVYPVQPDGSYAFAPENPQPNICILDTNSRLDAPQQAYAKAASATRLLQAAGCNQFFNKTCSVFRGNIGAEFDAMLDVLAEPFAVVVLGFPKNGRTTINGSHFVRGIPLAESEFKNDPIHPMMQSNLVDILQGQTERVVKSLTHQAVSQGAAALRHEIEAMKSVCSYLILDVKDQAALSTIAAAVHDLPVLCGSSALAEELPAVWGAPRPTSRRRWVPPPSGQGVFCVAGSLMPQTLAQIEYLRQQGTAVFTIQPATLFNETERQTAVDRLAADICQRLLAGRHVVFHAPHLPAQVAHTRQLGAEQGLGKTAVAQLVSQTVADVAGLVVEGSGQNRLVVAGGETSAAVCTRLGVTGLQIWREIQPGLPSCLTLASPPLFLVLKSGSFGTPAFLADAIVHLQQQKEKP